MTPRTKPTTPPPTTPTPAPADCYCGPQILPGFIRGLLSRHYNGACKNHDEGYTPYHSRRQVDESFRREITHAHHTEWRPKYLAGEMSEGDYRLAEFMAQFLPLMTETFGWMFKPSRRSLKK